MLPHRTEGREDEVHYDADTLRKVTALATRLQQRSQEMLTASDMEAIGREVGLDATFIREALAHLTRRAAPPAPHAAPAYRVRRRESMPPIAKAWFASAWCIPAALAPLMAGLHAPGELIGAFQMLGWGAYIFVGIMLKGHWQADALQEAPPQPAIADPQQKMSRAQLLDQLFSLQRALEAQRQHRAFLSVDVVGSSEMKRDAPALAVEYTFTQYRKWVDETIRGSGGKMQIAAGDGVMAMFESEAAALRAARELQEGVGRFNATANHLGVPFRLRCGAASGDVAIDDGATLGDLQSPVIDRAALLQKSAAPGQVRLSSEMIAAALIVLGQVQPASEPVAGEAAFAWQAG
jgi:class 3 adenylate cyclase